MIGALLVVGVLVPLVAGAAGQLIGPLPRWLSLSLGLVSLGAALAITGTCCFRSDHAVVVKLALAAWALPIGDQTTSALTLGLPADWGIAPSLLAAGALLLLATTPSSRHWVIHVMHGASQGALASTKPELGLAFVSVATGAACIDLFCGEPANDASRPRLAVRWALADLLLWTWVLGGLGVGRTATWILIVALALRICVFPFQGALVAAVRSSPSPTTSLARMAPAIWAYHWLDRGMLGDENFLGWFIVVAALLPAVLMLMESDDSARRAYALASILVWPAAVIPEMGAGLSMVGFGAAVALADARGPRFRIAGSLAVLAPTLALATSSSAPVPRHLFLGWGAVSLAAALLAAPFPRRDPMAPEGLGVPLTRAMEAALVILSLIPVATQLLVWTSQR